MPQSKHQAATYGTRLPLACCGSAIALELVLLRIPPPVLRTFLTHAQPWALETQFLAVVFLAIQQLPAMYRRVDADVRIKRRFLVVAAAASVLIAVVPPRTNRILFDEFLYQNAGQSISDAHLAQICAEGSVSYGRLQCDRGEYNKEPYGYPFLLSVFYRVVGIRAWIPFVLNTLACGSLIALLGLLTLALTGDPWRALGASLMGALLPEQLLWGNTAAVEPTTVLFAALAVTAAVNYCSSRSVAALAWMVAATAFAVNFRPESVLVVIVVACVVVLHAPEELKRPPIWWAVFALVLATALASLHLALVSNDGWGAEGRRFSLGFVTQNLVANARFFFADGRFPILTTVLVAAALIRERRRAIVWLVFYFLVFWGIFLPFYAGSYDYGADVRYSLLTYPPLCILAGFGWARLRERLLRIGLHGATAIAIAIPLVSFSWYLPLVRAIGEEGWAARADVGFVQELATTLPPDSMVLTQVPSMFLVLSVDAADVGSAAQPDFLTRAGAAHAGGLYLHWGYWCGTNSAQAVCEEVLDRVPHALAREKRVRQYRFALYRLDLPQAREEADDPHLVHADQRGGSLVESGTLEPRHIETTAVR